MSETRYRCATCGREIRGMASGGGNGALWHGAKFCAVTCALIWCRQSERMSEWMECSRCGKPVVRGWTEILADESRACEDCALEEDAPFLAEEDRMKMLRHSRERAGK